MWLLLLTETLGVSATPAREAIKRLQAEHALVVGSNRTPSVPVLTREDLRDLRDIRLALEGIATEKELPRKSIKVTSVISGRCVTTWQIPSKTMILMHI